MRQKEKPHPLYEQATRRVPPVTRRTIHSAGGVSLPLNNGEIYRLILTKTGKLILNK